MQHSIPKVLPWKQKYFPNKYIYGTLSATSTANMFPLLEHKLFYWIALQWTVGIRFWSNTVPAVIYLSSRLASGSLCSLMGERNGHVATDSTVYSLNNFWTDPCSVTFWPCYHLRTCDSSHKIFLHGFLKSILWLNI